jgi:hypothetical protein
MLDSFWIDILFMQPRNGTSFQDITFFGNSLELTSYTIVTVAPHSICEYGRAPMISWLQIRPASILDFELWDHRQQCTEVGHHPFIEEVSLGPFLRRDYKTQPSYGNNFPQQMSSHRLVDLLYFYVPSCSVQGRCWINCSRTGWDL